MPEGHSRLNRRQRRALQREQGLLPGNGTPRLLEDTKQEGQQLLSVDQSPPQTQEETRPTIPPVPPEPTAPETKSAERINALTKWLLAAPDKHWMPLWLQALEQPLVTTSVSVLGGLFGLIFSPLTYVFGLGIVLGVHRSRAFDKLSRLKQIALYASLLLVLSAVLHKGTMEAQKAMVEEKQSWISQLAAKINPSKFGTAPTIAAPNIPPTTLPTATITEDDLEKSIRTAMAKVNKESPEAQFHRTATTEKGTQAASIEKPVLDAPRGTILSVSATCGGHERPVSMTRETPRPSPPVVTMSKDGLISVLAPASLDYIPCALVLSNNGDSAAKSLEIELTVGDDIVNAPKFRLPPPWTPGDEFPLGSTSRNPNRGAVRLSEKNGDHGQNNITIGKGDQVVANGNPKSFKFVIHAPTDVLNFSVHYSIAADVMETKSGTIEFEVKRKGSFMWGW